jgi:hypothetical protein
MRTNMLKLNTDKTEMMLIASKKDLHMIDKISVKVGNTDIKSISHVKNLGVILDSTMTMKHQVNVTTRLAYHKLYKIGRIRRYLSEDVTKTLVNSLVTSRLDYCNSLLYGLPNSLLSKLQRVQNTSARVITKTPRHNHITPVLKELHWLPIAYRIKFKILLIVYKALKGLVPCYITELIKTYKPARTLRSQSSLTLAVPTGIPSTTYGERSFCRAAPLLWNALTEKIRIAESVREFKSLLKTHYFKTHYNT